MRVLDKKESNDVQTALYGKFNAKKNKLIWYPQNKQQKYLDEVFPTFVALQSFDTQSYFRSDTLEQIGKFLADQKISTCYLDNGRRVLELTPKEIATNYRFDGPETYIWDDSLEWIYCVTHESFSFLAGSKDLIDSFKKTWPDFPEFTEGNEYLGVTDPKRKLIQ